MRVLVRFPSFLRRKSAARGRRRPRAQVLAERLEERTLLSVDISMVRDINPGAGSSNIDQVAEFQGQAFFAVIIDWNNSQLWKSDGTAAGTVMVRSFNVPINGARIEQFVSVNGSLFFTVGEGLWKTDGTTAGTVMVGDAYLQPRSLANVGGTLFFAGRDTEHGWELWKSDGTTAGTVMVKDINKGDIYDPDYDSSVPRFLTNVGGTLFFTATDGIHGRELWKSDGTEASTVMVKDILPGWFGSDPTSLMDVEGTLFFVTGQGIWKSDGTAAGTVLVKSVYPLSASTEFSHLVQANGNVFFSVANNVDGFRLWKSDGTAAGTTIVRDVGLPQAGRSPEFMVNVNETIFYVADDDLGLSLLWKTDGTSAGTVPVTDACRFPRFLTSVNGALCFVADDAAGRGGLWVSDGTAAGTVKVQDFGGSANWYPARQLANVGGTLYYTADDGIHGREPWKAEITPDVMQMQALYGAGMSYNLIGAARTLLPWRVTGLRAEFDFPVSAWMASLLVSGPGAPAIASVSGSGTRTITWTFASPAEEARISASLTPSGPGAIRDLGGRLMKRAFSLDFQVLYGDFNGDGYVTSQDFSQLRSLLGMAVAFADINGDGVVDGDDVNIVRLRSGRRLPPP